MRTSGPSLPSGRSAGSTCHSDPRRRAAQIRISRVARSVATGASSRRRDPVGRLGDEDDVDVGDVVELRAPLLPIAMTARRVWSASGPPRRGRSPAPPRARPRRGRPAPPPSRGRIAASGRRGAGRGPRCRAAARGRPRAGASRPAPAAGCGHRRTSSPAHPLVAPGAGRARRPPVQCSGWRTGGRRARPSCRARPARAGARARGAPSAAVDRLAQAGVASRPTPSAAPARAARRRGRRTSASAVASPSARCRRGCGSGRPARGRRAGSWPAPGRRSRAGRWRTGIDPGPRELTAADRHRRGR